MDFLLSDKGTFLREPLLEEVVHHQHHHHHHHHHNHHHHHQVVEIIDNIGLTTISISSLLTNGLLPQPSVKPNKEKVTSFINFLKVILILILI